MGGISNHGLALFGDSIAAGLGCRGLTYGQQVADALGMELIDYSSSARPVSDSLTALLASDARPVIAVIAHATTEAIPRLSPRILRLLPGRWRKAGWTDPRPYFSSRPVRRMLERTESGIRWRVKNRLIRFDEPEQILPRPQFNEALHALIRELHIRGAEVFLLGPTDLSAKYFPGAREQIALYAHDMEQTGLTYIPLAGRLVEWSDFCADKFHPNDCGHARIAELLHNAILAALTLRDAR